MSRDQWERVAGVGVEDMRRLWLRTNPDVLPPEPYQHTRRPLTAMMGLEPYPDGTERWHISVRYGDPGRDGRVPTWDELVLAAHDLRPGVVFAVGIPPRSWWINVHEHVLHLTELRDPGFTESMRRQARGDVPT